MDTLLHHFTRTTLFCTSWPLRCWFFEPNRRIFGAAFSENWSSHLWPVKWMFLVLCRMEPCAGGEALGWSLSFEVVLDDDGSDTDLNRAQRRWLGFVWRRAAVDRSLHLCMKTVWPVTVDWLAICGSCCFWEGEQMAVTDLSNACVSQNLVRQTVHTNIHQPLYR